MAILKAELLAIVNDELRRTETNIDSSIIEACQDLSERGDFLPAEGTINTVADTYKYSLDTELTRFKSLDSIKVSGGDRLADFSLSDFLDEISGSTAPTQGKPFKFALREKSNDLFLWYVPDNEYELTVYYSQYHAATADTIEFAERFRKAIEQAVIAIVARKRQLYEDFQAHWAIYMDKVADLSQNTDEKPVITRPWSEYD